jgi:hypothetical protein
MSVASKNKTAMMWATSQADKTTVMPATLLGRELQVK